MPPAEGPCLHDASGSLYMTFTMAVLTTDQSSAQCLDSMTSMPPMNGRSGSGITTVPSAS
eukprot:scaffold397_cov403-Prasinococcus_capsulatus_cf.AAC.11